MATKLMVDCVIVPYSWQPLLNIYTDYIEISYHL